MQYNLAVSGRLQQDNRGIFFMKRLRLMVTIVMIMVLGIGMTVKAASTQEEMKISKEQYQMMEKEYLEEVRDILLEKGCKNAGVTLTYVTDAKEHRNYVITVHHARLEDMEVQEIALLEARMQEIAEVMLFAEVELKQL